jgi:hypothetical protein
MLVGLGHLGGVLLELLAREAWIGRIVACSRDPQRGRARVNLARLSAAAQGLYPELEYRQTDVEEHDRFATLVEEIAPQLIIGTATLQTWWLPRLLPRPVRQAFEVAGFGPWLPCHLAPTRSFMAGVRASSFAGPVLTAPFPDVVNPILGRLGLAPTAGIGNVDEIATKVRLLAAERLAIPPESLDIHLVAHHALESATFGGATPESAPPFHLRITHRGIDVTDEAEAMELLLRPYPIPGGSDAAFFTGGSTVRLVRALFREEPTQTHVPGPAGLPGGYPVTAGGGEIGLRSIPGLEPAAAVAVNERSHPFDGVEHIEDDGTVVFCADSVAIFKDHLGYDCLRMSPDEAPERGHELRARFRELAERHGIDLNRIS